MIGLGPKNETKNYILASARDNPLRTFDCVSGYAEDIPFPDRSFDYVVIIID